MNAKLNMGKTTLWKQLKAPALFGIGLYIGLTLLGDKETKEKSEYLEELKARFKEDKR